MDLALVDLFAQRPLPAAELEDQDENQARENEASIKAYQKWSRQIAKHLGQLSIVDGKAAAGTDRFSCYGGIASKHGLRIRIVGFGFVRPSDGTRALLEWLSARKCTDYKYSVFHSGGADDSPPLGLGFD